MSNFNIDYLVVAGGGGGGSYGGGGAGGLLTNFPSGSLSLALSTAYSITVGAKGAGSGNNYNGYGAQGSDSSISGTGITTITAAGGGYGGNNTGSGAGAASDGGSGGGGSDGPTDASGGAGNTPSTTPSQGNNGGSGTYSDPNYMGGGGGGAGASGSNATTLAAGNGGTGLEVNIIGGSGNYYAGGGGGVRYNVSGSWGSGGTGGGGNGGSWNATVSSISNNTAGGTNTGGGGGAGKEGGDGIIILRYATADVASYTVTGAAPTETTDGTDTILSFTTTGTGTITFSNPPPPSFSGTKVSNELLDFNQQNNEIGLRIPVGNDTDQPTADVSNTGSIRYNTDQQGLSISNGTEFQVVDSEQSTLPTVTLTNSWRAWDTASFVNGGTSCTDVTGSLVLGPYSSGSPGAFFYGSFNNVAGNKYWVLNGGGSHGRRAGFTRPTEFTISYWGNKPSNPGYNSERAIWSFNVFGSDNIRLARRNNAGTSSLRIYSGNSSIATFADGITTNTWYNITLTFSLNTVKTYIGVQGSTNTTLINTTTLSSGNFPTGILNDSNGTGFWIGTNSGYTDWSTDSWSGLNIYDGVARQAEIDTIVSNGYQQ